MKAFLCPSEITLIKITISLIIRNDTKFNGMLMKNKARVGKLYVMSGKINDMIREDETA